jgi:hypothetical protein
MECGAVQWRNFGGKEVKPELTQSVNLRMKLYSWSCEVDLV